MKRCIYGYGPVAVLMASCILVFAVLVSTMFMTGDSNVINNVNMETSAEKDEAPEVQESVDAVVSEELPITSVTVPSSEASEILEEAAEPDTYEFTVSDKSYFDDALFIGDSRTAGLKRYGTLENADYFASAGLNLYTINGTKVETEDGTKVKLEQMLTENIYGKIYIMFGINELGYNFDTTVEKYRAFIDYIFSLQPDTILYVCANMHVNALRNELDEIHNNAAINRMNEQIAAFADQKNIFYLDVNPLFDDENGNLAQEYLSDDTHLKPVYYEDWSNWYCENTIVKQ